MIPDFALVRDRATGWRRRIYGALSARMARHAEAVAPARIGDAHHGDRHHSHRRLGAHDRVVRFLDGHRADVALDDLRPLLRGRRHLQRHRRAHRGHGVPPQASSISKSTSSRCTSRTWGSCSCLMSLLWGYFVFAERLTIWYGNEPSEMAVFWSTQSGAYAPLFWTMVICNVVIPFPLLTLRVLRTDHRHGHCVARGARRHVARALPDHRPVAWPTSTCPTAGAPISRSRWRSSSCAPRSPRWGCCTCLFAKFVPIISIWELKVGAHPAPALTRKEQDEAEGLWRVQP